MKLGIVLAFQQQDWNRYETGDFSKPPQIPDAQIYESNLRVADLVEPLGFDSLFQIEHHGQPHHITGNPLDLLKYMAGRTERIEMGTCLIVLPWWHPIRAAEEICVVNHLMGGRPLHLGVGRGSSPREFRHLAIDMSTSTARFMESVDILRLAFTEERFSYEGKIYQFKDATVRPRPLTPDLAESLYAGATQQSSIERCAHAGLKLMHAGGATLEEGAAAVNTMNGIRAEKGLDPMRPIIVVPGYCHPRAERAEEVARTYFARYFRDAYKNYRYDDPSLFAGVKGYEDYAGQTEDNKTFLPHTGDKVAMAVDAYVSSGVWGTPEMCIEKVTRIAEMTKTDHLVLLTNQTGLTFEESRASMTLLAQQVLPAIRHLNADPLEGGGVAPLAAAGSG